MNWLQFSLLSAFFSATTDTLSKKAVADSDVLTVAWVRSGYALPFLLPILVGNRCDQFMPHHRWPTRPREGD